MSRQSLRYYLGLDNTPEERLILEVKTPEQIEVGDLLREDVSVCLITQDTFMRIWICHICVYVYPRTYIHIYIRVYIYIYIHILCVHIYTCPAYTHTSTFAHVRVYVSVSLSMFSLLYCWICGLKNQACRSLASSL